MSPFLSPAVSYTKSGRSRGRGRGRGRGSSTGQQNQQHSLAPGKGRRQHEQLTKPGGSPGGQGPTHVAAGARRSHLQSSSKAAPQRSENVEVAAQRQSRPTSGAGPPQHDSQPRIELVTCTPATKIATSSHGFQAVAPTQPQVHISQPRQPQQQPPPPTTASGATSNPGAVAFHVLPVTMHSHPR